MVAELGRWDLEHTSTVGLPREHGARGIQSRQLAQKGVPLVTITIWHWAPGQMPVRPSPQAHLETGWEPFPGRSLPGGLERHRSTRGLRTAACKPWYPPT